MFPRVLKAALLASATSAVVAAPLAIAVAQNEGGPKALVDDVEVRVVTDGVVTPTRSLDRSVVDDTALRYYASVRDFARVNAEIERLRQLDPSWEAPSDLFDVEGELGIDESALWRLYELGDFEAVRAEIAILQGLHHNWRPPAQLIELLDRNETRGVVDQAVTTGDWQRIIQLASVRSEIFGCSDVENAWALAQAHVELQSIARAYGVYGRLMAECEDAGLRLSTLQKALASRDEERLATLFDEEAERPKGFEETARFEEILLDFKGRGATAYTPTAEEVLGTQLGRLVAGDLLPAEISDVGRTVLELRNANGAVVLGYHHSNKDDWVTARTWFERSMAWSPTATAAEGLSYALMNTGDPAEAEELAAAWVAEAPALASVLGNATQRKVASLFESGDHAAVLRLLDDLAAEGQVESSLEILRGWSLTTLKRPTEAGIVFASLLSVADAPIDLRRDAAYGLALSRAARGNGVEARTLISQFDLEQEKRNNIEVAAGTQEAVAAFHRGDYGLATATIERLELLAPVDSDLVMLKGWSLFKQQRYTESYALFRDLRRGFNSPEAAEGERASKRKIDDSRGYF